MGHTSVTVIVVVTTVSAKTRPSDAVIARNKVGEYKQRTLIGMPN